MRRSKYSQEFRDSTVQLIINNNESVVKVAEDLDLKEEISSHQTIANHTLKKDKRVNLRMTSKDLEAIKTFAVEEGLPYQTLMSSVLHKFITGRLVDKQAG